MSADGTVLCMLELSMIHETNTISLYLRDSQMGGGGGGGGVVTDRVPST